MLEFYYLHNYTNVKNIEHRKKFYKCCLFTIVAAWQDKGVQMEQKERIVSRKNVCMYNCTDVITSVIHTSNYEFKLQF